MGVLKGDYSFKERNMIKLPVIQRGFVWKPYQIENIWDSLFRGFPIGSFLLAKTNDCDDLELFDGQQRATAIALGFYNPWSEDQPSEIGNAKSLPTIWVDLYPMETTGNSEIPILPENSERLFRVLTESHPWGYLARANNEKMGVRFRAKAWEQMKLSYNKDSDNFTILSASQRLPYSSRIPIPLCFLFYAFIDVRTKCSNCSSKCQVSEIELFKKTVLSLAYKYLSNAVIHFHPYFLPDNTTYFEALDSISSEIWENWFKDVGQVLDKSSYSIPFIILNNAIFSTNGIENSSYEDPTLFVRLNSGGTNLGGEELIYSIFKSFFPIGKKVEVTEIEKGTEISSLISPSRIIVLIARLLLNETIDDHSRFPDKINSRRFQSLITSNDDNHSLGKRMAQFIEEELKPLFCSAINILRKNGTVPDVVVKSFIRDSPNGFLLLLNFLRKNKEPDEETRSAVCRKLYRNYFFGNLDKISIYTFPDISKPDKDYFTVWGKCIDPDFWINDAKDNYFNLLQIPLIRPAQLLQFYQRRIKKASENSWNYKTQLDQEEDAAIIRFFEKYATDDDNRDQNINTAWDTFLWRLKNLDSRGKGLLLLAQNKYIQDTFSGYNQLKDLQDTNTPWDWDHIYPYSWMWGMPNFVYYWGNSLGNYRAMSLVDNRSESNNCSPQERCPKRRDDVFYDNYFINKPLIDQKVCEDRMTLSDLDYWMKIGGDYKSLQFRKDNLDDLCENLAYAAAYRTVSIYQHFYDLFGINDDTTIDTEKDH